MAAAGRRPPLALALLAGAVVALLLLPLAYLVVRVAERRDGRSTCSGTARPCGSSSNTVLLVAGVVVAAIVVAVPTAWLVTRTDLPGRRVWAVAAALPLVIPSYVAAFCLLGFFGERGLLAAGARGRAAARPDGLLGRRRGAHALDLPLRLPPHPGSAPGPRPRARGGRPRARRLPVARPARA